jgi:hypothetical protein
MQGVVLLSYTCVTDVINSIVFTNHVGGPLASDHENLIKNFGITPNALGRGHGLLETSGPAWVGISLSYYHWHYLMKELVYRDFRFSSSRCCRVCRWLVSNHQRDEVH